MCICILLTHTVLLFSMPLLCFLKASRVDKLQTELSSQRDKLEDATRMQSRLKEWKARNETVMEAKAMLEDQVEDLQAKVDLLEVVQGENAQLKAQMDSMNMVIIGGCGQPLLLVWRNGN